MSKSSVSVWTRDIELTEAQHERLRQANPIHNEQLRGQAGRRATARGARLAAQEHGRAQARRGDLLHLQGCMLFWAEGSKRRNSVMFTNADVEMHRVFLRFLRGGYGVADERVALTVNCFLNNGLSLDGDRGVVARAARAARRHVCGRRR